MNNSLLVLVRDHGLVKKLFFAAVLLGIVLIALPLCAQENQGGGDQVAREFAALDDDWLEDEPEQVYDPLEPVNRFFFTFNDKLYFWLLRPVARGYSFVVPEPARECVGNFFRNLKMPARFVNSLLQGKIAESGTEVTRFVINSTAGVVGLWDPARNWFDLKPSPEDMGQTLGKFGIGEGVYICWPFFGPSNVRDSIGMAGDYFLDPFSYLAFNDEEGFKVVTGAKSVNQINTTSLKLGDYESFKEATLDPYGALRDAYYAKRRSQINDKK
ncbi:MAG: VacJ family lipoprotein [Proteobacteria bacterium]|nr:VacJ family lipoprotein [Pseudomonadota bacterium]MBU1736772.1 VacJ family lipoprotein [Pseudomonadota bacterium]